MMSRYSKQDILAELEEIRKSLDSIERMIKESDDEGASVRNRAIEAIESANEPEVVLAKPRRVDSSGKTGKTPFRKTQRTNTSPQNPNNFTVDYNALAGKTGMELRNARADFLQRYQVRMFSCVNSSARMNTPVPPPEFRDKDGGDFWAIPSALASTTRANDNTYVVYPSYSSKQYTPNLHFERAMGEVFNSNFIPGNIYNKILVEQFAIFTCSGDVWTLLRKGTLSLE